MSHVNQLVINYHITEKCNYDCHYCYAKWAKPNELHRDLHQMKAVLAKLADYFLGSNPIRAQLKYESVRLNFAGGEPVLLKERFIEALDYAKELGFETSLITNGHLLTDDFISNHGSKFQMLGISYDAISENVQKQVGRVTRTGAILTAERLQNIFQQMRQFAPNTALKINTVVNQYNTEENLTALMEVLLPNKWKVLRVLPVFKSIAAITDEQFSAFVERHRSANSFMSVENNDSMTGSYLMISPDGSFFQNGDQFGGYIKSRSLVTTPIGIALAETGFDPVKFANRY